MNTFDKFVSSLKIILYQSRILGLTTLTLSDGRFDKSRIKCAVNILVTISFLFCSSFTMYQLVFVQKNKFIYKTTELIMLITSFSFVASVWISAVVKCDKLSQLFYQMIDFDKNLDRFGITICYEKQRKADVIELIVRHVVLIFIIVYYFVMGVYICQHDIYTEFVRLPLLVIKSAFCHQTIGLISMIKARFLVLNKQMTHLIDPTQRTNAQLQLTTLCKICDLHHNLCRLIRHFNDVFGVLLLVFFGTSFTAIVTSLFYFSAGVQGVEIEWKHLSLSSTYGAFFIGDVFYLCNVCYKTIEEVYLMGDLIHKVQTEEQNSIEEIQMFSLQIANERVEFSAAKFFPIDHSLIFSIVGGATTYIIILIQLSATLVID